MQVFTRTFVHLSTRKYASLLEALRSKSKELSHRLVAKGRLSEADRAVFYSNWIYSAIRQMTSIPGFQTLEELSRHFGISRKKTKQVVDFLLSVGLCREEKGLLQVGPATTHLESDSSWARMHHLNWRQKAVENLETEAPTQMNYTAPMTLSKQDAELVRESIVKLLESIDKIVEPSPSEELHCLNIDWFVVKR